MPDWKNEIRERLTGLALEPTREAEIVEELSQHLDDRYAELRSGGASKAEASRIALADLSDSKLLARELQRVERQMSGDNIVLGSGRKSMIGDLQQDLRYGSRMLRKNPGFTLVAVMTLALGIGANTAIFSVVSGVLLRPLPYSDPGRLVQFWETNPLKGWTQATVAPANLFDWQEQNQSFEDIAAYMGSDTKDAGMSNHFLTGEGEPERVRGLHVTGNLFSVLGVSAARGRTFTPEETLAGNHRVTVLSHDLWQRRFGGDPSILDQTISINGANRTVIGVMPEGFYFPSKQIELWVPMGWEHAQIARLRRPHFLRAIGRLKPGVSIEQARGDMTSIATVLEGQYPDTNTQMGVGLGPLQEWIVGDSRPALLVFLAAVGLVLLIACANVSSLLLARAEARRKEIAIRVALGAGRWRIIRQLLSESLLLALLGGTIGIFLAVWARKLLLVLGARHIPRIHEISLDAAALGFTLAITLIAAVLAGLLPAWQVSRQELTGALKDGQKGAGGSQRSGLRSLLVVSEIALSFMLVIGAGLLIKSFIRLMQVDPGIDPDNVLTLRVDLPGSKYPEDHQKAAFYEEIERRISGLPGVESVGATTCLPLEGYRWTGDATVEGRPVDDYLRELRHKTVTAGYFRTLKIPLLSGREYDGRDTTTSPKVAVVNEAFARWAFPNEDSIGRRVKFSKPTIDSPWFEIIGVVRGEKQDGLDKDIKPEVYEAQSQNVESQLVMVVRTNGNPMNLAGAVREEIRAVDRDLPPYDIKPMNEVLSASFARQRFTVTLLGVFALLALGLAAIGIYGVVAYSVTQRTYEIGLRRALGAQSGDVLKLVGRQLARLAVTGIGLGLAASIALTRLIASLLFDVSATDPATFAAVALLLGGVALLAASIPARRAVKVDPMVALRYE
ncbi:MAG TPA: ABC transporter permease [Blastocatellia bacterium]|nr:ABC transporter permease [Blastocatellia bacterium]